ncbi:MAG: bifunctional 23S rRNA (guanine(2069)-N(7))-methyltransferase RlmK/23S rRNA (guanine(2445)-N(2))-methyltransferase RlmL [Pirellulaceae bacterium]|nr:bifunctional 23S rRNA (guanine(2069)-N(7))-methyltransferase RlmK/23S rRNA (guanine(2445)-N(2))-methyltransferase RlmL [Pirellulaceae bacterium]
MNAPLDLIATTAFGLEAVVRRELKALGYEGTIVGPGRILFSADDAAICRTNLWLRTADRVLVRMASFPAEDFDALFDTTKAIAWDRWIGTEASFPVIGRSVRSQLSSVPACQRAVKKAVAESLLAAHRTSELPESGPMYKIEIALLENVATLTIDTTGPSLHKRGYRQFAATAPLKETMAAALIQLSFWRPERTLIDPFCGSGTIPIEAAMIGRNIAPGLNRSFAAEEWPDIDPQIWRDARTEARDIALPDLPERLMGTDIDPEVLEIARFNAEQAGVADQTHFQVRPFDRLTSKRSYGCVITNPPYGERLGDHEQWESLYESIPLVLRKLPTWSHYILTAYPRFESLIGRSADRRRKLYNGRIQCTYFQFHGPRPGRARVTDPDAPVTEIAERGRESLSDDILSTLKRATPERDSRPPRSNQVEVAGAMQTPQPMRPELIPVFGGVNAKAREQAELFRSRLKKRARHLRRWPTRQGITCFRLYERDIPEIPLIVDCYEDHLHITEYERPHDRDAAQHADWLDLMQQTASDALDVKRGNVFFKSRQRQRGIKQHEQVSDRHHEVTVKEGGLKFIVNLSDYIDTGLFLDHRTTRQMVREAATDTRFLNLFGYTGSFSVYAASGGAVHTTTVDLSRSNLDWARRNMSLNEFRGGQHLFIRSDARQFLQQLATGETYDLAVVDPPTFSNSKRTEEDWDLQRDHVALLNAVLGQMNPQGLVFFSNNFRRFKLDADSIASAQIHEISKQTVPEDFRNRRIHRCWRIVSQK